MSVAQQVREAQHIISTITARNHIPLSVFQNAILVSQNIDNLVAFAQSGLIASCIHALRADFNAHSIEYQLACLQVLAISLMVQLLQDRVDTLLDTLAEYHPEQRNGLVALSGFICRVLVLELESDKLTGYELPRTSHTNIVLEITNSDAEWLIEFMHSRREVLLEARLKKTTTLLGLASLLYTLSHRAHWRIKNQTLSLHLRDLVCRFALVRCSPGSNTNEEILIFGMIFHFERREVEGLEPQRFVYTNPTDMQTIVKAYAKRITPSSVYQPPLLPACAELLRWILVGFKEKMYTWRMFVSVIEASIPRLWIGLEDLNERGIRHSDILRFYFTEAFSPVGPFSQDHQIIYEDKISLVQVITNGDFIDLLGRVMLLGALDGPSTENMNSLKNSMHMTEQNKDILVATANAIARFWSPSPVAFDRMAHDWQKVLGHWEALKCMYWRQDDVYWQYVFQCNLKWLSLGSALGFGDYLSKEMDGHCAYPRCMGTHVSSGLKVCRNCGRAQYGSTDCQKAHWLYHSQPHSEECGETWVE